MAAEFDNDSNVIKRRTYQTRQLWNVAFFIFYGMELQLLKLSLLMILTNQPNHRCDSSRAIFTLRCYLWSLEGKKYGVRVLGGHSHLPGSLVLYKQTPLGALE